MGKSVAERRRQRTVAQNMMWPATFLPFVYGFGFTPPQQKKNKCEKRTSKQNKEVDAATNTCVHDGAGSSGAGTEASGVTEKHEETSANAAAAAATDLPIDPVDPFVDKCAKALAFGYGDAWPYSSFNRPGLIIMLLNNNKRNKET